MDAAYPKGTYTFNATPTGGGPTDVATLVYKADDYPQGTPYLAGTSFSTLQTSDVSSAIHIDLSPINAGNAANASYLFFTIVDNSTNSVVYNAGRLPTTTTGLDIAGGTLMASRSYTFDLDYSNRDNVGGSGAQFAPFIGFDVRTGGTFTTRAVPEPASMILLAQAGLGLGWAVMKRRSRKSIA